MAVLKVKDLQGQWQNIPAIEGNGIASIQQNADYTLTITFDDGTTYTTSSVRGATGNGISRIEKTGTVGLIDTYTIYFTDGNTWSYQISNGDVTIVQNRGQNTNKVMSQKVVTDGLNALDDGVSAINSKIPTQASTSNQLADKNFVNSSIATETAHYISNNGEPFTSLAQLQAYTGVVTNNDYAFVTGLDEQGNTYYDRYKASVVSSVVTWAKEYRLNNSSFTAAQWSAISSGITQGKVQSYDGHLNRKDNPHEVTKAQVGLGNVDNTSDANKPISTATQSALDGKQASLVSGTNIKSVNSTSLLGSGNLDVGTIRTEDSAVGNPIPLGYVPEGGTTGQVLVKNSNADFDTTWQNASGGGHLYRHSITIGQINSTNNNIICFDLFLSTSSGLTSISDVVTQMTQTNQILQNCTGTIYFNNVLSLAFRVSLYFDYLNVNGFKLNLINDNYTLSKSSDIVSLQTTSTYVYSGNVSDTVTQLL